MYLPAADQSATVPALAALALIGAGGLILLVNQRAWLRHRFGVRLTRLFGPNASRTSSAPATSAPAPPAALAPAGERAGLPGNTTPVEGPHKPPSSSPRCASGAWTASGSKLPASPAVPGSRFAPEHFELLSQRVDHTRRLAVAEERVATALQTLPHDRWLVERYVLVGGYRVPFVVLGECGVFAVFPISVRPQWGDTAYVSKLASYVKLCLPRYPGPVTAGICGVGKPDLQPRYWFRPDEPGGSWTMGLNWLIRWMQHFGHEHGLGVEDIARFRATAGPNWSRPVKPGPPGVPDFDTDSLQHE